MSETTADAALHRHFALLASSPTFALSLRPDGSAAVSNPPEIPAGSGHWLVHGTSHLADGSRVVSIFQIDCDGGGDTVMHAWWQTPKGWCSTSDRARLLDGMDRPEPQLFPCRFETTIPLAAGLEAR